MIYFYSQTSIHHILQDNVDPWLDAVGLSMYKPHFKHSNIVTRDHLEILKSMSADEIVHELDIHKKGKHKYANARYWANIEGWRVKKNER